MVCLGAFETPDSCEEWRREYALEVPVLPDEDGTLFRRLTSGWVPWSILVGADGKVVFSENEFDEEGFSAAIADLLAGRRPSAAATAAESPMEPPSRASGSTTTVVLGGGIGGVVVARRLRARVGDGHRIIVIDRSESHLFQSSLLWLLNGSRREDQIRKPLARLRRHGIEFLNEEIIGIDVDRRLVTTARATHPFDYLVVALGARTAPESAPGFTEMAHDLYSADGCRDIRDALRRFRGGRVGVVVTSIPFKCPAAPYEAAFLVEALLRRRGIRDCCEVHLYTPEHQPMPVAEASVGASIVDMLAARGIHYHPLFTFERMRPGTKEIVDAEGRSERADLWIAVPPHRVPDVVRSAGLSGVSGWIHVDPETLRTGHPRVYAIGDVTSIRLPSGKSLPKAGVFAHHEAEVVAAEIASQIRGESSSAHFAGDGACWVEVGGGRAAFARGNFYRDPEPRMRVVAPSRLRHWAKVAFERWWLWRWF